MSTDEFDDNAQTIPSKKVKIDWSHSSQNGHFKICILSLTEKNIYTKTAKL